MRSLRRPSAIDSGVRGRGPDEIRQPEGGMYGRRLPIPLWVQDCPYVEDAQILHIRANKPRLLARKAGAA